MKKNKLFLDKYMKDITRMGNDKGEDEQFFQMVLSMMERCLMA